MSPTQVCDFSTAMPPGSMNSHLQFPGSFPLEQFFRPILPRSIHRWKPPDPTSLPARGEWQNPAAICVSVIAATHNAHLASYFLFEQFQIGLPPEQIAIILHADWHRTGGCHPIPKSELPP